MGTSKEFFFYFWKVFLGLQTFISLVSSIVKQLQTLPEPYPDSQWIVQVKALKIKNKNPGCD